MNGTDHTGKKGAGGEFAAYCKKWTQRSLWATPSARDYKTGRASQEVYDRNSRPLSEQAFRFQCGLQAPTSSMSGERSSDTDPTSPPPSLPSLQLNVLFVEWLMLGRNGIGWTEPTIIE